MKTPAPADLQRWSDEVARDPASLAFLPLARAYRKVGQRQAAMQLCLRGLQHYPSHAEAHGLLALLYLEDEQRQRAADEWSIVLRLDPDNFEALRGLGFCYLEQDQLSRARQTLERAALLRPADPAVQEALRLLGKRQEHQQRNAAEREVAALENEGPREPAMWSDGPLLNAARAGRFEVGSVPSRGLAAEAGPAGPARRSTDPTQLFAELADAGSLHGALLLDAHGLVLAGSLEGGADAAVLGAILGGAIGEAVRTASHLALGEWQGILLESERALVHLAPVGDGATVLLAAHRGAPAGWVLRVAEQARELGRRYLEAYA